MRVVQHGPREIEGRGIAVARFLFDFGSARIWQPEHLAHFVECLAGRIIARATKPRVMARTLDIEQERVTAGNNQRQVRRHGTAIKKRREQVALEVVDPKKRAIKRAGDTLRDSAADQQR